MDKSKTVLEVEKKTGNVNERLDVLEQKIDMLNANVVRMIESIRIFKLNFQQQSLLRS